MTQQLQEQCELGQQELSRTRYIEAEQALVEAEAQAWLLRDFDTLARLYLPLQEARRQRRQQCGEGDVCLDLWSEGENDLIDGRHIVENYPCGQLLVAGWATLEPARSVRRLQKELGLYLETFMGAVYRADQGLVVVIAPSETGTLPPARPGTVENLLRLLPPHCLILREQDLPRGIRNGNAQTYAEVMAIWERLHEPFLAAAEAHADPLRRIEAYRKAIEVDYACEEAHQRIADIARHLARSAAG